MCSAERCLNVFLAGEMFTTATWSPVARVPSTEGTYCHHSLKEAQIAPSQNCENGTDSNARRSAADEVAGAIGILTF